MVGLLVGNPGIAKFQLLKFAEKSSATRVKTCFCVLHVCEAMERQTISIAKVN
jgi:DNA replicative helicase MCM subunit Mcm2 (Cdc46/Mcm family)